MNNTLTLTCECGRFLTPAFSHQIKDTIITCSQCYHICHPNESIFWCGKNKSHSNELYICQLCAVASMVYDASNSSKKFVISTLAQFGYEDSQKDEALKISQDNLQKALQSLNKIDKKLNGEKIDFIHNKYLNYLVDGYLKTISVSKYIIISTDITHLIIKYHGNSPIGLIAYLKYDYFISTSQYEKTDTQSPRKLQLVNINSERFEFGHLYYTSQLHEYSCNVNANSGFTHNIVTRCRLPVYFQNFFKRQYNIHYEKLLLSNKWNFIFNWNKYSYITIVNNEYPDHSYTVRFPKFAQKQSVFHCIATESSFAYSKINDTLYNMRLSKIYSLDFNEEYDLNWTLITKNNKSNNSCETNIISSCMVDHDRFIFNAYGGLPAHCSSNLFALNSQITIALPERINDFDNNANSIYHQQFHKIIFSQNFGMEWYDMNKDIWIDLLSDYKNVISHWDGIYNVWYSEINPNIIYGIKNDDACLHLMGIDLRNKNNGLITDITITKPKYVYGVYLPLL